MRYNAWQFWGINSFIPSYVCPDVLPFVHRLSDCRKFIVLTNKRNWSSDSLTAAV